ncbi:MAG: hypothetical protein ACRDQA_22030 [Nocardioidaceae bacterium]
MSHAAVYRHFPSKAALREAVTRRWLGSAYDVDAGHSHSHMLYVLTLSGGHSRRRPSHR